MKPCVLTLIFIQLFLFSYAQPLQNVRGTVVDSESQYPLAGVKIIIFGTDSSSHKTITNADGQFTINKVKVGKYTLTTSMMTYDDKQTELVVNSGKETILRILMNESFLEKEEVTVSARKKGQVINELALISAQQFSVEETDRYPGSRSDPARMASNFAGVSGADDSRNDIVIRGNSPLGVIYKVEGIDIPNPSHFAISGSTGGPVSIINNKILGNSDFFMSAFPAEYGNSISGIFDLKLRQGNNKNHEFTGQFGLLGTEIMAEGPMSSSGNSSYLVMGRYSTLSMFQLVGIKVGTDAIPTYGDGAFKLNWKLKNGGQLGLFAIGGASSIDIIISEQEPDSEEIYGEGDRDQYFSTAMAVTGLTYKKPLNEKTFVAATLAYSFEQQKSRHDYLARTPNFSDSTIKIDSIYPLMAYTYKTHKVSGFFSLNHKINKRHLIKAGLNVDAYYFDMHDSVLDPSHSYFVNRWDYEGASVLVQPFVQWKWRLTKKMAFTAGVHAQYFELSNSISPIEPRIGWKWNLKNGQSIFAGAGLHSQAQPMYTYLYHQFDANGDKVYHNKNMDFTRSAHTGIGYEKAFNKGFNIKTEAYYQQLYNVPVTITPSSFSMINMGSGFQRFFPQPLENSGTGVNYGLELTVQKFFSKSFFFLISATVYDSKYKGSDGILRNTSYNGMYVANFLGGKEFKLNEKQSISVGVKVTTAGGKRYGYVDVAQTEYYQDLVYKDSLFNERQFKDYFRLDLKVNWKYNTKKATHEIGLDLVNVLNTTNLLSLTYAPNPLYPNQEPIAEKNQLGFLPIFYYKIDFKIGKR